MIFPESSSIRKCSLLPPPILYLTFALRPFGSVWASASVVNTCTTSSPKGNVVTRTSLKFSFAKNHPSKHQYRIRSRIKSSGPSCLKLMTSLVNVTLKFQTYYTQHCHFFAKKMWGAFAAKNISTLDCSHTRRLNESLTNDFVKLTMLWTTGPWLLRTYSSRSMSTVAHTEIVPQILFDCFEVLWPVNTTKVMSSQSVNLSTLFLGRPPKQLNSTKCQYFHQ